MRELMIVIFIVLVATLITFTTKFNQQEKKFAERLKLQNKKIIFVNNPDLDFKTECYQPDSFFCYA